MPKVKIRIAPEIMKDIFEINNKPYKLLYNFLVRRFIVHSVRCGTEKASLLAPKLWDAIPEDCKNTATLIVFKEKIKSWVPKNDIRRICKTCIRSMLHSYRNQSIDLK